MTTPMNRSFHPQSSPISRLFTRHQWGAEPPRQVEDMTLPVSRVVSTWADVDPCYTPEECSARVREVQRRHMHEEHLADVRYNFLIGGDGNIYEGRGWFNLGVPYPDHYKHADELNGKSVEFGFLLRAPTKPPESYIKTASDCVAYGLVSRMLQEKVLFYWRTHDNIMYLNFYETNAPGTSNPQGYHDPDQIADPDRDDMLRNKPYGD